MGVDGGLPGDALDEAFSEMVERDGDLHDFVVGVFAMASQEHYLVVIREIIVGNRDSSGGFSDIDQAIGATGEEVVIDPHITRAIDRNGVAISLPSVAEMVGAAANHRGSRLLDVVDVQAVDDDIVHVLNGDARATRDVHIGAPPVDGLEAVHDELVLQLDVHVA